MRGVKGSTPGHGTNARYSAGCHCERCRDARRRQMTRYRMATANGTPRTVDGLGTARRFRALAAIGWSAVHVGPQLGCGSRTVQQMTLGTPFVLVSTAEKVSALYHDLCMTPGPSVHARRRAAGRGWAPPLAWDDIDTDAKPSLDAGRAPVVDDVAVDRALAGVAVHLTAPERVELIRRMAAHGRSDAQIAARTGVVVRTVQRIRAAHEIPSTWRAAA